MYSITDEGIVYKTTKIGKTTITEYVGRAVEVRNEPVDGGTAYYHAVFNADTGDWERDPENTDDIVVNGVAYTVTGGEVIVIDNAV